ncbi:MAG: aminoacyl-tRNA hydrolase [Patescibacteria group bacterium]|nr:aminoacyl-tRNA hydrolase [Patescibacteria group bacterium]
MTKGRPSIKLIIGLGNPSEEYQNTYHNIGSVFLDYLKGQLFDQDSDFKSAENFLFMENNLGLIISKPKTFMNESGWAVKKILEYFNTKPENTIIVHDDSDIELEKYKIEFDRGSAGHKGIKSIIDSIGSGLFWRIRIGIREKNEIKRKRAEEFVLKKIKKIDLEKFANTFKKINGELKKLL